MANNYLNFSVAIEFDPDRLDQLKELDDWNDCIFNNDVESGDVELILATAPEFAKKWLKESDYVHTILEYEGCGFSTKGDSEEYYVYCEEYGYVDSAIEWIYLLIRMELLRPKNGYVTFAWAHTCDKPRPDEFSGGVAMISSYGIKYQQDPWNWSQEAYQQLHREIV